jgi:hypothetical protein
MSENLDLVRSIYADWEQGDFRATDWAHPEIVLEGTGFDAIQTRGVAEMRLAWRDWMKAWDAYRVEADDFRELDDDRVLVLMHHGGAGKASGVGIDGIRTAGANLFEIQRGKVTRLVLYWERDQAFADLGLEE